jgi:hypothetical protein
LDDEELSSDDDDDDFESYEENPRDRIGSNPAADQSDVETESTLSTIHSRHVTPNHSKHTTPR